jgi:hypothetical protein
MERVVAIHQPNFLPWAGFFDKMDRCDVFVLLDRVQLLCRNFTTRVQILQNGKCLQLSMPVQHSGTQEVPIGDAIIDRSTPRRLTGPGKKSELMTRLTLATGGNTYLSGGHEPSETTPARRTGTAADYNDPAVYGAYGVKLRYQNFVHPEYDQGGCQFVPGLSVLDLLVRHGNDAWSLIRQANGRG